ncbi:CBS domain-containing protein [Bradyrhizobium lablabi]|uniref:CBS domain-containing protein n=1 Tax=Bradyrhizobium lablabi TaxID=722472 RepID=UPI001BA9AC38|nr:CBS domain-containing protein [Bradyrhizobium lablabi]MBR1125181.1 CBS domain-containing protein [Bradyrhizobium lablabi]
MRAHQIMTRQVITTTVDTPIVQAARTLLLQHISGMPVLDEAGKLVGVVSQGDFMRRAEIGTQRRRPRWLKLLVGPGRAAVDFVRERGRKVGDVMNAQPITVSEDATLEEVTETMEKNDIKRVPVMRGDELVGIITRTNLVQAVLDLARDVPDPTADDDHVRNRIFAAIEQNDWTPFGLGVTVRGGIVHLSGVITDERSRKAAIVAAENVTGVRKVHDHLVWLEPMSGVYVNSPEDEQDSTAAAG